MGGMKIALPIVPEFSADGKLKSDEFTSANGSPEKLLVQVAASKKIILQWRRKREFRPV
jgi:hypothetical protein